MINRCHKLTIRRRQSNKVLFIHHSICNAAGSAGTQPVGPHNICSNRVLRRPSCVRESSFSMVPLVRTRTCATVSRTPPDGYVYHYILLHDLVCNATLQAAHERSPSVLATSAASLCSEDPRVLCRPSCVREGTFSMVPLLNTHC